MQVCKPSLFHAIIGETIVGERYVMVFYKLIRRFALVRRVLARCCLRRYLTWEGKALTEDGYGRYVLPAGVDVEKAKRLLGIPPWAAEARDKAGNVVLLDMRLLMSLAKKRGGVE